MSRDLAKLEETNDSFKEISKFFKDVAEEKGAEYAFSLLKEAPLPEDTDLHLLGHVVGDVLYKKQGKAGINICTHDFRNACSHSIVIGLFTQKGKEAIPEISEVCRNAPGGSGAYTMCFHGLGHGVLAYTSYDLEEAVDLCGEMGTSEYRFRESAECIGGLIMEMTSGGQHDKDAWERAKKIYFKENDPLYPCSSEIIPESGRYLCYSYLTPHLLEAAGADLGNPTEDDYGKAFEYCEGINVADTANRDACFGGFGKEFLVLANERDIRTVDSLSNEKMEKVYSWCLLAPNSNGTTSCIRHAVNSLYWGGENDVNASIRFCSLISDGDYKDECFKHLIGAVYFYSDDQKYLDNFCNSVPESYQDECINKPILSEN